MDLQCIPHAKSSLPYRRRSKNAQFDRLRAEVGAGSTIKARPRHDQRSAPPTYRDHKIRPDAVYRPVSEEYNNSVSSKMPSRKRSHWNTDDSIHEPIRKRQTGSRILHANLTNQDHLPAWSEAGQSSGHLDPIPYNTSSSIVPFSSNPHHAGHHQLVSDDRYLEQQPLTDQGIEYLGQLQLNHTLEMLEESPKYQPHGQFNIMPERSLSQLEELDHQEDTGANFQVSLCNQERQDRLPASDKDGFRFGKTPVKAQVKDFATQRPPLYHSSDLQVTIECVSTSPDHRAYQKDLATIPTRKLGTTGQAQSPEYRATEEVGSDFDYINETDQDIFRPVDTKRSVDHQTSVCFM